MSQQLGQFRALLQGGFSGEKIQEGLPLLAHTSLTHSVVEQRHAQAAAVKHMHKELGEGQLGHQGIYWQCSQAASHAQCGGEVGEAAVGSLRCARDQEPRGEPHQPGFLRESRHGQ